MDRLFSFGKVFLLWLLMACPLMGQVDTLKAVTEEDHGLWSNLVLEAVSDDGQWTSYSVRYPSGKDTLFVQSTVTKKRYAMAGARSGSFAGGAYFGCITPSGFELLRMETGKVWKEEGVSRFAFAGTDALALYARHEDGTGELLLRDLQGRPIRNLSGVEEYAVSPDGKAVAYVLAEEGAAAVYAMVFRGAALPRRLAVAHGAAFHTLVWQDNGHSIAFASRKLDAPVASADALWYYDFGQRQLLSCELQEAPSWPKELVAAPVDGANMVMSPDGQRVYVSARVRQEPEVLDPATVQVWNTADYRLPTYREKYGEPGRGYLVEWTPRTNGMVVVGDTVQAVGQLNRERRFVLLFDSSPYRSERKNVPDRDCYLQDFATGRRTLVAEGLTMDGHHLAVQENGERICYFREGHWYAYDTRTRVTRCISKGVGISFAAEEHDKPEAPRAYGSAGWTPDGRTFLLYDRFDLWAYRHGDGKIQRLTHGREAGLRFRMAKVGGQRHGSSWMLQQGGTVELEGGILLEATATDHSQSGLYVLKQGKRERQLLLHPKRMVRVLKAGRKPLYVYQEEDFAQPPRLHVLEGDAAKGRLLYGSNPHHNRYQWGRSELVSYANSKGQPLKGVLFYPAGYDKTKSYPMVVNVYERQNGTLHTFVPPSIYDHTGFNRTLYTLEGYFVFLPDIVYEVGNPGFSGVDCVVAGTAAAVAAANIDPDRIGLYGTSFGGYQVNFIITQSDRFRAAVAGAAVNDLASAYLSMGWNYGITDIWRFESQQMRMGRPLFQDLEAYADNSPIRHAAAIKTPLLSFAGGKDYQVNPFQSMELFVALRKLQKPHVMLLYPEEEHVINGRENRKDLTTKMLQWFGHHLKGTAPPSWMRPDTSP